MSGMMASGHDHEHSHSRAGQSHAGHAHHHGQSHKERRVGWAGLLTAGFMVAEAVGGVLAGSLALLADAGHMLIDSGALVLAWAAFRIARRPADWTRTYGFHRFQVLAAFTNGITLFFIAAAIVYEAAHRLNSPVEVLAGPMLAIAALGLAVNIAAFLLLHGAERDNLNIRGAVLHVVGDMLGSVAAIAAALVILWTSWTPIDPLLSVLVALLILRSAWFLVRESGHVLLEAAPPGLDIPAMREDLVQNIAGLEDVHHVHAWSLTPERPMITLHARVADVAHSAAVRDAIKARLLHRYRIDHATVEIECETCADGARPSV
jgi:cobalt-zinc-cadmium efflux system protein